MKQFFLLLTLAALLVAPASAQSISFDDFAESVNKDAGEVEKFRGLLNDADPNKRIIAMSRMLESGDEILVRLAKETGLFSPDPQMRAVAVTATLNAGGNFRAEFTRPADMKDATDIELWLNRLGGTWNESELKGVWGFSIGEYDEAQKCWKWLGTSNCALRQTGEKVFTDGWYTGATKGLATLALDTNGALTGDFMVNGKGRPVTIHIPLID